MSSNNALDPTNMLILPATVIGNFRYADWDEAAASGPAGIVGELARSAVGINTRPFLVPCSSEWKIEDIQALLYRHGIKLWGVGYWNNELYFRVKGRQAHWAQYVLLRAGIPLRYGLLDGSRAVPGYGRAQDNPPANDGVLGRLLDLVDNFLGRQPSV